MKTRFILILLAFFSLTLPVDASERANDLVLKTNFHVWNVRVDRQNFMGNYQKHYWNGLPIKLEDQSMTDSLGVETVPVKGVNQRAVRDYLNLVIAPTLARSRSDVSIDMTGDGDVVFDGFAFDGQTLDVPIAIQLIRQAIYTNEPEVRLPLLFDPAQVTVLSPELEQMGVKELISTGETGFAGSPFNRRHNIDVGLHSFTGQLIAPGESGSAVAMLGRIDASTGYLPELVIKGDKTVPEYGGGLCQVSSTLYRGVLFAGLPVTERRNHSYSVSYYDPQGLDATIYPGSADLKFLNDTSYHILIQTTTVDDKAYASVYGTKVDRSVDLIGPYYYSYRSAPPPRVEYSADLAPGEKEVVGQAHTGFKASWYRRINQPNGDDVIEHIYSDYQPRPYYTIVGAPVDGSDFAAEGGD